MKEYQEPTAKIVEFLVKDIVICSGEGPTIIDDTGTGSVSILGATRGSNGLDFN